MEQHRWPAYDAYAPLAYTRAASRVVHSSGNPLACLAYGTERTLMDGRLSQTR
eukprot:SAG31_NODE_4276_length_3386_cov_1.703681_1_plen_52_part_10